MTGQAKSTTSAKLPSESTPVAIVLGGTNPHRALVENLKRRGYHVLLADYLDAPPAAEVADEHVRISAMDVEAVYGLAAERKASLVISVCLDRAIPVVAEVSYRLGLPSIYTPENALRFTDKVLMKQIFELANIPTAKSKKIQSLAEAEQLNLPFPFILKPADSTGSLGIGIVRNAKELAETFAYAVSVSDSGVVLAEELLEGRELSVDCIVADNVCSVILVRERLIHRLTEGGVQCYGTLSPAPLPDPKAQEIIGEISARVSSAFGIVNAPLMVQGYLTKQNEFKVLEIAVRLGGGLSFRAVHLKTGLDQVSVALDFSVGACVNPDIKEVGDVYAIISIYARGGMLLKVTGVEGLKNQGVIAEYFPYKPAGTVFADVITARNRVSAVIIEAPDHQVLYTKIAKLFAGLRVLNTDGRDMLAREIEFVPPPLSMVSK